MGKYCLRGNTRVLYYQIVGGEREENEAEQCEMILY